MRSAGCLRRNWAARGESETIVTEARASFAGFWLQPHRQTLKSRVAWRGRDVPDVTVDAVKEQDRIAVGEVSWRRFDSRCEAATLAERMREIAAATARSSANPIDPTDIPREEQGPHS